MKMIKLISLVSLGGSVELYDFMIFAAFSKEIGATFFPNQNPKIEMISALILFAIGYLIRPIGGIVFSHFGDKIGRKKVFMSSILIMGLSTLFMAFIPSYASIGVIGSTLFILLRVIQGLALGGEVPGAITFISEHTKRYTGLACGFLFLFNNVGILIANTVYAFNSSSWRISFIIGAIISFISYALRVNLSESPAFRALKSYPKIPLMVLLKKYWCIVVAGILIASLGSTIVSVLYIAMTNYLKHLHYYSDSYITTLVMLSTVTYLISMALMGGLSDLIGRRRLLMIGIILFAMLVLPFYELISTKSEFLLGAFIILGICSGMITGVFPCLLAEMFPTELRYTGVAICFNISFAIFGGLSPLLATLIEPAYIILMVVLINLIGLYILNTSQKAKKGEEMQLGLWYSI